MTEFVSFLTAKLGDLDETFYLAASCSACRHAQRISPARLRAVLPDDFPLTKLRTRLKCSQCGARDMIISFLNPSQEGMFFELFQRKAE